MRLTPDFNREPDIPGIILLVSLLLMALLLFINGIMFIDWTYSLKMLRFDIVVLVIYSITIYYYNINLEK